MSAKFERTNGSANVCATAPAGDSVRAWQTEDGRVISAEQKRRALKDGGASASSVAPYKIPLIAATPALAGREAVGEVLALDPPDSGTARIALYGNTLRSGDVLYAHPGEPVTDDTDGTVIPSGIYYSVISDNFYAADTGLGMGTEFYLRWRDQRNKFPATAADAARTKDSP